jgi:type III pantothenate kinase
MGLEALGKSTAQLPGVFSDEPKNLIGRDTEGCLLSGAFYGTAAMIDGLAAKMIKPFDGARVIVTGGNASAVIPFLSVKTEYVPELLLEGLYIIYRKNKG